MRRIVLKIILLGGRYAVLPVVALAGALLLVWLMAIDRYTRSHDNQQHGVWKRRIDERLREAHGSERVEVTT